MNQHTRADRIAGKTNHLSRQQKLARAAGAVPLAGRSVVVEPMEPRRLLAVTFDIDINDPSATYQDYYNRVVPVLEAAAIDWGENFASNAAIQVELRFETLNPGTLAQAGPVHFEPIRTITFQGESVEVVEEGPVHEIRTGVDPNSSQADGIVTVNTRWLDRFFYDETPEKRDQDVPGNQTDFYSVMLHELGHMIGFFRVKSDFSDNVQSINPDTGNPAMTTFDEQSGVDERGNIAFLGPNAVEIYGGPLPLTVGNASHYGNQFGPGEDLAGLMMGPSIGNGEKKFIELLDLAILADIGLPMVQDFTPIIPPVLTVTGTNRDDVIEIVNTGSHYIVKINRFPTPHEIFDENGVERFTGFVINAGGGDDVIILSSNMPGVQINGEDGRDRISGSDSNDTIFGGASGDFIHGNGGRDLIDGGGGHDRLFGDDGEDRIFGGNDNDTIEGGNGHDSLFGASGDDSIFGNNGNDTLNGQDGNDFLHGLNGRDQMNGGSGADFFRGGDDFDFVDYEDAPGDLIVTLDSNANDGVFGEGDNLESGIETIRGGNGNDYIEGDGRINQIHGGPGADTILGGSGDDRLIGDAGPDRLYGTSGDDTLEGGGGHDHLFGGSGRDQLFGGQGNDRLHAIDREEDTLFGGAGIDIAEFNVLDNLTELEELIEGSI